MLTGDAVVNASPYEVRSLDLNYAYTSTRTTFSLAPYLQNRDYVDSDEFDQESQGVRADLNWLVRRSLSAGAYATRESIDYTQLGRTDDSTRFGAVLRYQWAPRWSSALQWERYRRDSTAAGQTVSQNIVYLSISYSNR